MTNNKYDKGELAIKRYNFFAIFRYNLVVLQATKNCTNQELSTKMGLRPKRVGDFKQGRVHPNFDEIREIAKYFDVNLDNLLYKKAKVSFD
jgi:ribosome-binding protein aMBF1 (putative translation factor)